MISGQTIKGSIEELGAITKVDLCVMDLNGEVIATAVGEGAIAATCLKKELDKK